MRKLITLMALSLLPTLASADWQLDSDASSLSFVSLKNGAVMESHEFTRLEGNISSDGKATVTIELDSVKTLIPIRNERMREMLFNTAAHPNAVVSIDLTAAQLEAFQSGSESEMLSATLSLAGVTEDITLSLNIVATDNGVIVSSRKPAIIQAAKFRLTGGVEALREIAGLKDITMSVPVSFTLKFDEF